MPQIGLLDHCDVQSILQEDFFEQYNVGCKEVTVP